MRFRKAVITAASADQRALPLQTLVDRDGNEKSVLAILIEQALAASVEEICIVVWPGDQENYLRAAGSHAGIVRFAEQAQPLGYAHAVHCAREFVGDHPFLHMVSDHIYVSGGKPAAQQVAEIAAAEECSVSGVQATHESHLPYFGAVGGRRLHGRERLYRIDTVLEKPTPTEAEQRIVVSGMRAGYYLCFFGIHAFTPAVTDLLGRAFHAAPETRISLSSVLAELAAREQYLALEANGKRYNIGARYGLLTSQLALALHGRDRADVLAEIVELLADRAPEAGSAL